MILFPNAKINIGLNITERRPDGFHNLESCVYPVPWNDIVEIVEADMLGFENTGIPIAGDPLDNLCLKAYHLIKEKYNIPPVFIHLHKQIPIGAGLGGGSADASFALHALNDFFELGIGNKQLKKYARKLGSDCAFFIDNIPTWAIEKGDQFETINLNLKGHHIALVYPNISINTKEAYTGIKPKKPEIDVKNLLENSPMTEWKDSVKNDFESSLFPIYPELPKIKEELYQYGAVYASMSGSGATVYGIFKEEIPEMNFMDYLVFKTTI